MRLSLYILRKTAPTATLTLSLHDALPIFHPEGQAHPEHPVSGGGEPRLSGPRRSLQPRLFPFCARTGNSRGCRDRRGPEDRKSTRLNSSHTVMSYAVFCLKKKTESTSSNL